jgi:hypothetical protein
MDSALDIHRLHFAFTISNLWVVKLQQYLSCGVTHGGFHRCDARVQLGCGSPNASSKL